VSAPAFPCDSDVGVVTRSTRRLALPLAAVGLSGFALYATIALLTHGVLPNLAGGLVATLAFVATAASLRALLAALAQEPIVMLRRPGFWVVTLAASLTFPTLGAHSLVDPWESHYAEVAREMLARGDWISTFWAHEGWFTSKPVLSLWLQALAMRACFVHHEPGRVLEGAFGDLARPEWALRTPFVALSIASAYLLFKAVSRARGARAGVLGALVLVTAPQWLFVARQTMTDAPLVAGISAALGFYALGALAEPERRVRSFEVALGRARLRVSAFHAFVCAVIVVVVPQLAYLASRNFELVLDGRERGVFARADTFSFGSAGNCTLLGQLPCAPQRYAHAALQPALQAAFWLAVVAIALGLLRGERRAQRLYFASAWLAAAIAVMSKGLAGLAIPAAVAVAHAVATRSYRRLLVLANPAFVLVAVAAIGPWYLATYARHGTLFVDELVFRHMLGRTLEHLHDTNAGVDTSVRYYVWQLGYALFPWSGLAACAAVSARPRERGDRASVLTMLTFAFGIAFALASAMATKFHHYVLPAVPPLAMMTGVWLDRWTREDARAGVSASGRAVWSFTAAALLALVARDLLARRHGAEVEGQQLLVQLFTYQYARAWPATLDFTRPLAFAAVATGVATLLLLAPGTRRHAAHALAACALATAAFLGHVYLPHTAQHWGEREVIAEFYARRAGRDEPLVAYRLNWKGENYYTGNHLVIALTASRALEDFVRARVARGAVVHVVTEHASVASLRSELSGFARVEAVTDAATNHQFTLVRVVGR
jgi:4-amino-4-deoxy-L-arabinose transferase-like glycosyltransferase